MSNNGELGVKEILDSKKSISSKCAAILAHVKDVLSGKVGPLSFHRALPNLLSTVFGFAHGVSGWVEQCRGSARDREALYGLLCAESPFILLLVHLRSDPRLTYEFPAQRLPRGSTLESLGISARSAARSYASTGQPRQPGSSVGAPPPVSVDPFEYYVLCFALGVSSVSGDVSSAGPGASPRTPVRAASGAGLEPQNPQQLGRHHQHYQQQLQGGQQRHTPQERRRDQQRRHYSEHAGVVSHAAADAGRYARQSLFVTLLESYVAFFFADDPVLADGEVSSSASSSSSAAAAAAAMSSTKSQHTSAANPFEAFTTFSSSSSSSSSATSYSSSSTASSASSRGGGGAAATPRRGATHSAHQGDGWGASDHGLPLPGPVRAIMAILRYSLGQAASAYVECATMMACSLTSFWLGQNPPATTLGIHAARLEAHAAHDKIRGRGASERAAATPAVPRYASGVGVAPSAGYGHGDYVVPCKRQLVCAKLVVLAVHDRAHNVAQVARFAQNHAELAAVPPLWSMMRLPMYNFVRAALDRWPIGASTSIEDVIAVWLAFIRPWSAGRVMVREYKVPASRAVVQTLSRTVAAALQPSAPSAPLSPSSATAGSGGSGGGGGGGSAGGSAASAGGSASAATAASARRGAATTPSSVATSLFASSPFSLGKSASRGARPGAAGAGRAISVFAALGTGDPDLVGTPAPESRLRVDGYSQYHWLGFVEACALLYLSPLSDFIALASAELDYIHDRSDGELTEDVIWALGTTGLAPTLAALDDRLCALTRARFAAVPAARALASEVATPNVARADNVLLEQCSLLEGRSYEHVSAFAPASVDAAACLYTMLRVPDRMRASVRARDAAIAAALRAKSWRGKVSSLVDSTLHFVGLDGAATEGLGSRAQGAVSRLSSMLSSLSSSSSSSSKASGVSGASSKGAGPAATAGGLDWSECAKRVARLFSLDTTRPPLSDAVEEPPRTPQRGAADPRRRGVHASPAGGLSPDVLAGGVSTPGVFADVLIGTPGKLSDVGLHQVVAGTRKCSNRDVPVLGDPDLVPATSVECAFLVRLLARLSHWTNATLRQNGYEDAHVSLRFAASYPNMLFAVLVYLLARIVFAITL